MGRWLLLDIGNSNTVAGIAEDGRVVSRVRYHTGADRTGDEYRALVKGLFAAARSGVPVPDAVDAIERVVCCSVVPALERTVRDAFAPTPTLIVDSRTKREFDLDLPHPEQLGSDRLANVAGALRLAAPPFVIVDAGTATTFCLVDSRPAYIGGAIAPGLETGWRALRDRAARLYGVDLVPPPSAVGNTTETQIQSGVLIGYEALIEGLVDRLLGDAPAEFSRATFLATGGCMALLRPSARFRIEPDLTLLGLLRYGELNG
jgi:type III pantothenate kinase